jgi:hypothetical protein
VELAEIDKDDQKNTMLEMDRHETIRWKTVHGHSKDNYFCQQNKGYYSSVFTETVQAQEGGIMIEGKYAGDPTFYYYAVGM